MEFGFFGWIIVGLIAGALAKWIMPGNDPGGIIVTILIGIAGGILGGFIATSLPFLGTGGTIWNLALATAGAVLLLWIYRMMKSRSS
ncbi:MAG: GlsB/YeaQ/YmgE family stress response membrane protein [Sandarakinorhabdus sp.]|nr:GlsB/YeaQ/YmgE family stress response membrane protein [Sandarakinorhabdus sp.]